MSEAREKARALLAEVTPGEWTSDENADVYAVLPSTDGDLGQLLAQCLSDDDAALIAAAPGLLEALCDENDALRAEVAKVTAAHAFQSSEVNGLTAEVDCMEHEDTQLRAEVERLRAELAQEAALRADLAAEVERLKARNAVLGARVAIVCECVKSRQGPMGGSIARPLPGCDECGGTGGIIVDGDA